MACGYPWRQWVAGRGCRHEPRRWSMTPWIGPLSWAPMEMSQACPQETLRMGRTHLAQADETRAHVATWA